MSIFNIDLFTSPSHTSATSTCISAYDQNPNLMIPYTYSTEQAFLGKSAGQGISCILQKWYICYCPKKPSILYYL